MEEDQIAMVATARKDNSNCNTDRKSCANISNIMESQNNVIENESENGMVEVENVDNDHLVDENSSPSMLNEIAEAIIADNFKALKDDKQAIDSVNDSSSKFHLLYKVYMTKFSRYYNFRTANLYDKFLSFFQIF